MVTETFSFFQESQWNELLETLHKLPIPDPGVSVHLSVVSGAEDQQSLENHFTINRKELAEQGHLLLFATSLLLPLSTLRPLGSRQARELYFFLSLGFHEQWVPSLASLILPHTLSPSIAVHAPFAKPPHSAAP